MYSYFIAPIKMVILGVYEIGFTTDTKNALPTWFPQTIAPLGEGLTIPSRHDNTFEALVKCAASI